uniref:Phospholipase A2-like central domain-containing protein n=1 Tax=Phasianus colchicus TaxID=9054 RepID=A0A669QQG9_PHACC
MSPCHALCHCAFLVWKEWGYRSCGLSGEHGTAVPHSCSAMAEWGNTWRGTARSSDRPPSPPGSNNECEMLVCNCDRTAAMCFAKAPYNPAHLHLNKEKYCSS